jgi:hypothetical protein
LPGEVSGASAIRQFAQYALMLVLITVVGIATLTVLGQNSKSTFLTVKNGGRRDVPPSSHATPRQPPDVVAT